ncbi:MAG TPA: DNA N-6-adenine-methyltransferase [Candidatus Limnocylindria bacterium]|jgi:site-specific DNA-methyltransferase (adenine-specific)|nr:DNA N-6-adenine-methyltransferase [Candidatus Limnocylindria bacterium]
MNIARWGRQPKVQRTPDDFFRALDEEFHFTLDAAASDANAKCPRYFTQVDDSLSLDWAGEIVWLNPPYGRDIDRWLAKSYAESTRGATVVVLVPSMTETAWWHNWAMPFATEIRFVRGRLQFLTETGNRRTSAFFGSAVLIFRGRCQ